MNIFLKIVSIGCMAAAGGCSATSSSGLGASHDRFEGNDIEVRIDGQPTVRTDKLAMIDSVGVEGRSTTWKAASVSHSGKPCFEFTIKNAEYIGVVDNSDLTIVEYRPDREQYQWRDFKSNPDPRNSPPYSSLLVSAEKKYCPTDFFLTSRLKFDRLPPGDYYVAFRVGGKKSWDRQEIFLRVE